MHAENIADLALRNSALDELVDRIIPVIKRYLFIRCHHTPACHKIVSTLTVMCLPIFLQAWLMARHLSTAVVIGFSVITRT